MRNIFFRPFLIHNRRTTFPKFYVFNHPFFCFRDERSGPVHRRFSIPLFLLPLLQIVLGI